MITYYISIKIYNNLDCTITLVHSQGHRGKKRFKRVTGQFSSEMRASFIYNSSPAYSASNGGGTEHMLNLDPSDVMAN